MKNESQNLPLSIPPMYIRNDMGHKAVQELRGSPMKSPRPKSQFNAPPIDNQTPR